MDLQKEKFLKLPHIGHLSKRIKGNLIIQILIIFQIFLYNQFFMITIPYKKFI